jgi:hypothetical protein
MPNPSDDASAEACRRAHPAWKSRAIWLSSGAQRDRAGFLDGQRALRCLLIAVIGVEPIALIVLDASQRRGVHLVQDHAQDSIQ